jgi:hypothetical protein
VGIELGSRRARGGAILLDTGHNSPKVMRDLVSETGRPVGGKALRATTETIQRWMVLISGVRRWVWVWKLVLVDGSNLMRLGWGRRRRWLAH